MNVQRQMQIQRLLHLTTTAKCFAHINKVNITLSTFAGKIHTVKYHCTFSMGYKLGGGHTSTKPRGQNCDQDGRDQDNMLVHSLLSHHK